MAFESRCELSLLDEMLMRRRRTFSGDGVVPPTSVHVGAILECNYGSIVSGTTVELVVDVVGIVGTHGQWCE